MKIRRFSSQVSFLSKEKEFLDSSEEQGVLVVLKRTEAIYCEDGSCDIEWCKEHGIPYAKMPQGGGCIIGVNGNVFINIKKKCNGGEAFGDRFTKAFAKHLREDRGLESTRCDNNDVLVDGFKVASAVETTINGWQYMSFQVSLYQDIETISHVCTKPMVKVPKGLGEYGVTTDEMVKFIKDYWKDK